MLEKWKEVWAMKYSRIYGVLLAALAVGVISLALPVAAQGDIGAEIEEFSMMVEEHAERGMEMGDVMKVIEKARWALEDGREMDARELLEKAHHMFGKRMGNAEEKELHMLREKAFGLLKAAMTLTDVGEYGEAAELSEKAARFLREIEHMQMLMRLPPEERERVMIKERLEEIGRMIGRLAEAGVNIEGMKERFEKIAELFRQDKFDELMPEMEKLSEELHKAMMKHKEKQQPK